MSNNYFQIYLNSTQELAETLVIKSEHAAHCVNRYMASRYRNAYDPAEPRTWKYYLNIAGEYHPRDRPMYITSLDTLERILFSKENLALHRATSRAYQYGSRHYRELLAQYPENEQLILGVLYPCELDDAIAAPDYSILSYPEYLVEQSEPSLIPRLSHWIHGFIERWHNTQYRISDDLYEASVLGVLYLNLVPALLALRLEAARTDEVHSYYIKQYFASHGRLDRYLESLTRKQVLFLYRNLRWFARHEGRTESYEWLVDRLLTERHIPLMSYRMSHSTEELTETLLPVPIFKPSAENRLASIDPLEFKTTPQMLEMQDKLATLNATERVDSQESIQEQFSLSLSNRVQTKALQSVMYDYSDSGPYRLSEILMNHWVYLSSVGIYNSYVSVENPRTGDRFPLSARDTYILANYLLMRMWGLDVKTIPTFTVSRVQRIIQPDLETQANLADRSRISLAEVSDLLRYQPTLIPVVSIDAFYEKCYEIFRSCQYQRYKTADQEDFQRRGQYQTLHTFVYGTKDCQLTDTPDKLYAEWFAERNLDIEDYLTEDIEQIYASLVNQATGVDLSSVRSIRNIQADMLAMMGQLSSYSIHFLRQINSDSLEVVDWPTIRPSEPIVDLKGTVGLADPTTRVFNTRTRLTGARQLELSGGASVQPLRASYGSSAYIEVPDLIRMEPFDRNDIFRVPVSKVALWTDIDAKAYEGTGIVPVPGIEQYLTLTEEQRASLPEIQF